MSLLKELLVVINALILPILLSLTKQVTNRTEQYAIDLQKFQNTNYDDTIIKTGQFYQSQSTILLYIYISISVVVFQFIYLQFIINTSFRKDKDWLLGGAIVCMILTISLPFLLLFGYFYEPKFIGKILVNSIGYYLNRNLWIFNYVSLLTILYIVYILSNSLYLLIFNSVHYICIPKVV